MQQKATNFSRLPISLEGILSELNELKKEGAQCCTQIKTTIAKLTTEHGITIRHGSTRTGSVNAITTSEYRDSVAVPYVEHLISDIKNRSSDAAVKLLVSSSVFDPALLPTDEATLSEYGVEQLQALVGSQVTTELTYSSPPLIDGDEIYTQWKLFKRALARETKAVIERKNLTKPPCN